MNDENFMRRALELAAKGQGTVSPNPLVGCVIVYEETIIGEGFHYKAGAPHAEINAIESVKNRALLPHSTLYVTLEPCAHFGKTPPCALRIIEEKIKRVVVCNRDPFEQVNGKGTALMEKAGIDVITGVLEQEGRTLNRRFFTSIEKQRPYVILKWAKSLDGFMDIQRLTGEKGSFPITGLHTRRLVHKWRSEEDAILVGYNTIMVDDPQLNTRYYSGKNPLRVVIDPKGELNEFHKVFQVDSKVVVFTDIQYQGKSTPNKFREYLPLQKDSVGVILESLHQKGVRSVLVEGGRFTLSQFIASRVWDEVRLLTGQKHILTGMPSPDLTLSPVEMTQVDGDRLEIYYNPL